MKEFVLQGTHGSGELDIDYKTALNAEQYAVVEQGDGPCLVLAGAGSGKTRTITYRVAWLLEHGIHPEEILLLTFTNKAAREMMERVEGLLGPRAQGLWAGTFHSISNRILRKYAKYIGFESNFSILDQEDSRDLISLIIKEARIDTKGKRFPNAKVLQSLISMQRNTNESMAEVVESMHPTFLPILSDIEMVADVYEKTKRQQNAMDFDDLLLKLLELLRTNEDVARGLSSRFRYILVDEFQDTNVVQADLVERLSREHRNVLVVGDDAQSIYSFRGAQIQNILSFGNVYGGAKEFRLVTNYRSTPQILGVANSVITHNTKQFEKQLKAVVPDGEKPFVIPAPNASQEAEYIAEQILELHRDGVPLSEIAVLFRAAFHAQGLEFELMKRDLPYEFRGGMKFFERSHIKDVIAHIRVLHNVKDAMAWVRILRLHPGIGIVTAGKIANQAGQYASVREVLDFMLVKGKKAAAGWQGAARILTSLVQTTALPSEYIRVMASHEDYAAYLENEFPNYQERLEDLEQFAIFAEQFDNVDIFLEAVSLTDDYGASRGVDDRPEDVLILSTIHQAKGLEWDAVFVMNLADGKFPHSRSYNNGKELEEERRLFYVATTRARKRLFMSYPVTAGYEHVEIQQPSIFLGEIPENMIEMVKLRRGYMSSPVAKSTVFTHNDSWDEPAIELDDMGEEAHKASTSFLRDIQDL